MSTVIFIVVSFINNGCLFRTVMQTMYVSHLWSRSQYAYEFAVIVNHLLCFFAQFSLVKYLNNSFRFHTFTPFIENSEQWRKNQLFWIKFAKYSGSLLFLIIAACICVEKRYFAYFGSHKPKIRRKKTTN